ncbi:MAG: hypothetical protein GYA24_07890 [Candidatus Lokiarchaeota archaeon]|nr:hypothetical protein [Candidatus Lokiarchaeota archaeon]
MSTPPPEAYLEILRKGITPFDRFVSRGDIKDQIDVPAPRGDLDARVMEAIDRISANGVSLSIPILGVAGSGKTHAYHALKDKERGLANPNWTTIYIPSPPSAIRILFHVYTCIVNEYPGFIDIVAKNLVDKFQGKFMGADNSIDGLVKRATSAYPLEFHDPIAMLIVYGTSDNKHKKTLARRWIFGEGIDEREFENLGIHSVIEEDNTGLAMIRLITEYLLIDGPEPGAPKRHKIMVFFFDEFESPFKIQGAEAEAKFIDTLNRIFKEVSHFLLIAAVLKDVWEKILGMFDDPFKARMQALVELKPFTLDDVKSLIFASQEQFWKANNMPVPQDMLFPLNEAVLKHIFERARGNPRETIKLTRVLTEKIVSGELALDEITGNGKPRDAATQAALEEKATKEVDGLLDREALVFDVNAANVIYAFVKGLQELAFVHHPEDDPPLLQFEHKFISIDAKEKTVGALLQLPKENVAFDIPAIKTFDRSAGVAAYYCAKRLDEGIKAKRFNRAIMVIPTSTGGEKLQYILESNPALSVLRIDQSQAELIVKTALDPDMHISQIVYEMTNIVMKWDIKFEG